VGFLAAAGVTAVLGVVLFGVAGLAVAVVAGAILWRRRRARRCTLPAAEPVAVDPPRLRSRS
jgi:uncharacterized iron-regulated membrane protein